ncbi:hypothetical protein IMG5_198990 [Ichthyophthirius multifiliis]|uniref:Rad50/SbcC-type AAA domain-containing protein n=1 Tax=Ichthyophthirius multifiliis TaxID=5932 RepID=G0R5H8_ICHMU|nr:hypothetical protein IMG5_198990 [Ichthyophthirius multifiliis]EGR27279.1 hypothetical protein IMG5_198990 [Ichthyophthirius multifiliis]|eukprot:XP_004024163.1 hypothetical protein IMG5_198990 [Ichthyophthirius multifiliis]
MSYLKKLGLFGIRSYGDQNDEKYEEIHFFKPLTLILGCNGTGKSTIIEALKVITTGQFPPNSGNGKSFIKDPKLYNQNESQGSISLIFKSIYKKQILVRRLFKLKRDANEKLTFDSKDQTIQVRDENGKDIQISHKVIYFYYQKNRNIYVFFSVQKQKNKCLNYQELVKQYLKMQFFAIKMILYGLLVIILHQRIFLMNFLIQNNL